MIKKKTNYSC